MSWKECNEKDCRGGTLLRPLASIVAAILIMTALWAPRMTAPGSMSQIKPMYQSDYKNVIATIGGQGKSVWTSGCGAVVVAMAAGYMRKTQVSCEELFKWACDNGYYHGSGLDHGVLSSMLELYALSGRWIDNDDVEQVVRALQSGRPVVAHVGPGTFTKNGHYILLIGYKDGKALVNDPGSRQRSGQYFDLELIRKELRREKSFMIVGEL